MLSTSFRQRSISHHALQGLHEAGRPQCQETLDATFQDSSARSRRQHGVSQRGCRSRRRQRDQPSKEIDAVFGAKISISQAIAAAEQATGGKAYSARIDNRNGVVAYEVKTAKTGALEMVSVDINAGNVIKVTPIDAKADDNEQSD